MALFAQGNKEELPRASLQWAPGPLLGNGRMRPLDSIIPRSFTGTLATLEFPWCNGASKRLLQTHRQQYLQYV